MYLRATSYPLSPLRFLAVCAFLLLGAVKEGYGQRVYADVQQSSTKQSIILIGELTLSEVINQTLPIDSDTSNFSTLSATVGALSLIRANQNLQFVEKPIPSNYSPIIVKYGSNASLINLFGSVSLQRTNGGRTILVEPEYEESELLDLLSILLGSGQVGVFIIPADGEPFDGVRLQIEPPVLAGTNILNFHYAFYITPPEIPSTVTACEDTPFEITVANYNQAIEDLGYPYSYQLYADQLPPADPSINETPIGNITFDDGTLTFPADLPAGDYYLEARENGIYPSARTKITLVRNNVTGGEITGNQTLCANITPAQLSETTASSGTGMLTYQWQSKTSGNYTDIPSATTSTYNPPTLSETTMYRRATKSTVNSEVCEAFSNEITITVNPVPTISLNASTIHVCQEDDVADFPYSTVTNTPVSYSIQWYPAAQDMGFQDISNETHNFSVTGGNIPISIPPGATESTYQGVLTVRNSLGCISTGQTLMINVLPKPSAPNLNINPNSQY